MANKPHVAAKQHLPDRHPNNDPKVDHLGRIRELANQLHNASPSGANTISAQILEHLDAHADPKAYDEKQAEARKALEADQAQRQKNAEDRGEAKSA
jgi:hypothetical protein